MDVDGANEASSNMDDSGPLVHYDIEFRKSQKLPESGADAIEVLGAPGLIGGWEVKPGGSPSTGGAYVGVSETLEDDIKWEPHVDEADKLDYVVAVSSGVLAGIIDAVYVGEFSLDRAIEWGKDKVEKFVMKVSRAEGYKGDDLKAAIRKLERDHPFASDGNANYFGGGLQHHLRDFSHHFSIGGLLFSIFTQFTRLVVGTDKAGRLAIAPVPESHRACIGRNFQEKVALGTIG